MLRKHIINKYISDQTVDFVIGHSWFVFIVPTIRIVFFLFAAYVVYSFLDVYLSRQYMQVAFILIGIGLLIKHTIDFFDFYFDCLILTHRGIYMLLWDGLREYKTDFFQWHAVETVSNTQDSLWDKVFNKGDIIITLNHATTYEFKNVVNPKKMVNIIRNSKEKYCRLTGMQDEEITQEGDKYNILMEALNEVVQEYSDKKKTPDKGDGLY